MEHNSVKMEWLMEAVINPEAEVSLARMTVSIGAISELHHHTNCSETIHVLSGKIKQRIGQKWHIMNAGDTCLISIGESHQTENIADETAVMMVAYSAGERVYVKD